MAGHELRFRIAPELEARLRARDQEFDPRELGQYARKDSASLVARRDLARYYDLLERELTTLSFTEAEASVICDANNGIGGWALVDDNLDRARALLWANVHDALVQDAADAKHGLGEHEAAALVDRLRRLTPGQALAVLDAVERFWAGQGATVQDVGLAR